MIDQTRLAPELLYLLHKDPAELAQALAELRPPDIAEALRDLPPAAAAKVVEALPFDLSVNVFDEPELAEDRCEILLHMNEDVVVPLIEAMSSDQRADVLREMPSAARSEFLKKLDDETRQSLQQILLYPSETAGGIMTTEFVAVPENQTVAETLDFLNKVAHAKETIYAIYLLDPLDRRLAHVVSLRELIVSDPAQK